MQADRRAGEKSPAVFPPKTDRAGEQTSAVYIFSTQRLASSLIWATFYVKIFYQLKGTVFMLPGLPHVRSTRDGYRMACPKGHTNLILRNIPNMPLSYAPQVYCPQCRNRNGGIQPVCSIAQLEEIARRDANGDPELFRKMVFDIREYFGI